MSTTVLSLRANLVSVRSIEVSLPAGELTLRVRPASQPGVSGKAQDWMAGQARHDIADGAQAVLVLDGTRAWLDTPHATGSVTEFDTVEAGELAARWTRFIGQGFVAADAALLALWNERGPLPCLSWSDAGPHPVPGTTPVQGLYAIVDSVPRLRQVLDAGIRLTQLRIKQPHDADAAWFASLRAQLRDGIAAARDAGAALYVNDHWRVAAELGAHAVHLGQEDLLRLGDAGQSELAAAGMALGVSSHAVWELCRARLLAPAYIACGPVWPTTTKDMPWRPQGLDNLGWWSAQARRPVVAIGGILDPDQVRLAARAGAGAVCLVRGLGDDPRKTVPVFQAAFDEGAAGRVTPPRWPHPSLEPTA